MHRLNALLLMLLAILIIGCGSATAPETDPDSSALTQQLDAETPTAVPTVNIAATVEARVQATLAAQPAPSPTAPPDPTSTPVPTLEATPIPTSAPPTPTVVPPKRTPRVRARIRPTATPNPSSGTGGGGSLKLDPTPENRSLIQLDKSHPALAKTLSEYHWVQDGVSKEESGVPGRFRLLASQNASLAEQVVGMPFISDSAEAGDSGTLYALYDLSVSFPINLELLRKQDWFTNGLTQNEAHHYWSSSANQNLPLWIGEGGPDFLATYVSDQFDVQSMDERRRDLSGSYGRVGYCKGRLGIDSIQELLDKLNETGITKHQESSYFGCNYGYGEILALNLF